MRNILRDPIWEFIGVLIAFLSLVLAVYVARDRIFTKVDGPIVTPTKPSPPATSTTVVTDYTPTSTLIPTSTPTLTSTPPPGPTITITSPRDGDKIPRTIDVKGEYSNIPEDMDVWLYAYATGIERYFLNQIGVAKSGSGRWSVNDLIVGSESPQEEDAAYKIGVLLAACRRGNLDGFLADEKTLALTMQ
jgi:hypothetical protein